MSDRIHKERILSGMRPTGQLHLGHYHGVLKNWVAQQSSYDCFFFVADWHALTTHYDDPSLLERATLDMVVDWLAAGVDPQKATLFVQSTMPEHAELHVLLSMMTPLGWLERVPTFKDQQEKLREKDLATYGFLGYPLLQSADILLYRAQRVPVGADQVSHVELTREVARRFNHLFGPRQPGDALPGVILPEPQPLLTEAAKMPGLDGQKMSKSYGNTITLREEPASVAAKVKRMPTDPARVRRTDPGDPERCPVWAWHQVYSDAACQQWVQAGCRSADIGCIACKGPLIDAINAELSPLRARAAQYEADPVQLRGLLAEGAERARAVAADTLHEVRSAMGLAFRR